MITNKHVRHAEPKKHCYAKKPLRFLKSTFSNGCNAVNQQDNSDTNQSDGQTMSFPQCVPLVPLWRLFPFCNKDMEALVLGGTVFRLQT